MKNPMKRKKESQNKLKGCNIPFIEHLPCVEAEDEVALRSKEDILERMIAIAATFGKATNASEEELNEYTVFHHPIQFTSDELRFMNNESPDESECIQFSWKIESIWVLFWCTGLLEKINYPSEMCDVDYILERLITKSKEKLLSEMNLKNTSEILDYLDLIYRMHWAGRDAQIKGLDIPGDMVYGVVYERHYALNWLTFYMDKQWDNISTDT